MSTPQYSSLTFFSSRRIVEARMLKHTLLYEVFPSHIPKARSIRSPGPVLLVVKIPDPYICKITSNNQLVSMVLIGWSSTRFWDYKALPRSATPYVKISSRAFPLLAEISKSLHVYLPDSGSVELGLTPKTASCLRQTSVSTLEIAPRMGTQ